VVTYVRGIVGIWQDVRLRGGDKMGGKSMDGWMNRMDIDREFGMIISRREEKGQWGCPVSHAAALIYDGDDDGDDEWVVE
jgi:hypothetical protein